MPIPKICKAGHDWIVFDEDDREDCPLCAMTKRAEAAEQRLIDIKDMIDE